MIIYEITATVQPELIEKFEQFMRARHIPDLLATGYFQGAEFALISAGHYRIRYETSGRSNLDEYLATQAQHLREDFIRNFPAGVGVSREILRVLETWRSDSV